MISLVTMFGKRALTGIRAGNDGSVEFATAHELASDKQARLFVVKTKENSVKLEIIAVNDNPIATPQYPAASEQTIKFRFTATDTPIKGGEVWVKLPSWGGLTEDADEPGRVSVAAGTGVSLDDTAADQLKVGSGTATVKIKEMPKGGTVTITYGGNAKEVATVQANAEEDIVIRGSFKASANSQARSAGSVKVEVTNVADGSGTATIMVSTGDDFVQAGSIRNEIRVRFTAAGTMDEGKVSLQIPTSWGRLQQDRTKRNYIAVEGDASLETVTSSRTVAKIDELEKDDYITFVYGGGTGGSKSGAQVQDEIGIAEFTIKSDGDGDGVFALVAGEKQSDEDAEVNPDDLGRVYDSDPGALKIDVVGASDGSGYSELTVKSGDGVVRAADENVKIEFVYTPTETIENGALEFITPKGWSDPQSGNPGENGYTTVSPGDTGASLGTPESDGDTLTVAIYSIDKEDEIKIAYGATDTGLAKANTAAVPGLFTIRIKGSDSDEAGFLAIRGTADSDDLEVTVEPQASGKGEAVIAVTPDDGSKKLYAGQMGREFTIIYTAAGQMIAGSVRLTIPAMAGEGLGWSAPTSDNVTVDVSTGGSRGEVAHGGEDIPSTQMVTVDGVGLKAGGMVTFGLYR